VPSSDRPEVFGMSLGDASRLQVQLQALFGAELLVERELGRGGMAVVFLAFDAALQRRVAVKMLLPEAIVDVSVVERFLREGRTVASLDHPHVVRVMSVRSHQGTSAIVMQYVDGPSLDVVLQQRGRLPIEEAGRILSQVAAGLQHAHDRGVIHRDVKPANVLIDRDGRAIVTDFGIARRDDGSTPTKTGFVLGTVDYMSPEQRAGERVSPATDQYALGVMAFELLTGRLPFVGDLGVTTFGHMTQPPPRLQSIRPELPDAMETLVQRMLAKAPEDRWPSLTEVGAVFGGAPVVTPTARRAPVETASTTPQSNTPVVIRAVRETPSAPPPAMVSTHGAPTPAESTQGAPVASRAAIRGFVGGLVVMVVLVVLVVLLR
jgi:eukaryotic-like serine/threonine-protein kinase